MWLDPKQPGQLLARDKRSQRRLRWHRPVQVHGRASRQVKALRRIRGWLYAVRAGCMRREKRELTFGGHCGGQRERVVYGPTWYLNWRINPKFHTVSGVDRGLGGCPETTEKRKYSISSKWYTRSNMWTRERLDCLCRWWWSYDAVAPFSLGHRPVVGVHMDGLRDERLWMQA